MNAATVPIILTVGEAVEAFSSGSVNGATVSIAAVPLASSMPITGIKKLSHQIISAKASLLS